MPYDWSGVNIRELAEERLRQNRFSSKTERWTNYNLEREMIGLLGERAFAQWADLPPSTIMRRLPVMANFIVEGIRIDVRSSEAANYLAVPEKIFLEHRTAIDLYVLARTDLKYEQAELIGWCPYWLAEEEGEVFRLGVDAAKHKPSLNLHCERLFHMSHLRDELKMWKEEIYDQQAKK